MHVHTNLEQTLKVCFFVRRQQPRQCCLFDNKVHENISSLKFLTHGDVLKNGNQWIFFPN